MCFVGWNIPQGHVENVKCLCHIDIHAYRQTHNDGQQVFKWAKNLLEEQGIE